MYVVVPVGYPLVLTDFNETEFFQQIFKKYWNVKFHINPSGGVRIVQCGQTDRHNKANGWFSQFCKHT